MLNLVLMVLGKNLAKKLVMGSMCVALSVTGSAVPCAARCHGSVVTETIKEQELYFQFYSCFCHI